MRGPIGKSREQRLLEGNPGKRPLPAPGGGIADLLSGYEPSPERPQAAPIGRPPKDLAGEALTEWRRVVPLLSSVVTSLDRVALAGYCRAVGEAAELTAALREMGATYTTAAGLILPRPEVRMQETARRTVQRLAAELGLTPASRARLGIDLRPPAPPDPAERFFE